MLRHDSFLRGVDTFFSNSSKSSKFVRELFFFQVCSLSSVRVFNSMLKFQCTMDRRLAYEIVHLMESLREENS